jgi:hypothetical protein
VIIQSSATGRSAGTSFVVALQLNVRAVKIGVGGQRNSGPALAFSAMANIDEGWVTGDNYPKFPTLAIRHPFHAVFSLTKGIPISEPSRLQVRYVFALPVGSSITAPSRQSEARSFARRYDFDLYHDLGFDQLRNDLEHECWPHVAQELASDPHVSRNVPRIRPRRWARPVAMMLVWSIIRRAPRQLP